MYKLRVCKGMLFAGLLFLAQGGFAQIDPYHRSMLQLGYDQPLTGLGPQGLYAYYYYNNPEFHGTNTALRLAVAPAYFDGEIGFKQLLSPYTDVGLGFYGGAYSDNYYEVRQGEFVQGESFEGYGGGTALSVYHLLNPGMLVPLSFVARGGIRYTTYDTDQETSRQFTLPDDRFTTFNRVGLRLAGKEPVLQPDLGMELSVWYERQWRSDHRPYGFAGDRQVEATSDLYWLYAGLNYSWTNTGQQVSFAMTLAGSSDADRFSAWRLGGVLPLVTEFPMDMPGYYYEELTAKRVAHFHGSYLVPLDKSHRLQFRAEVATAYLDYLSGFEQTQHWQTGAGGGLEFTPKNKEFRIVLRYGYGFNAVRDGEQGAHSIGILFQYDFDQRRKNRVGG